VIDEATVLKQIGEFLHVHDAQLRRDAVLADLVHDSFRLVELVIELQESTGARLDQEHLREVKTVGDLAALVAGRAPA
jgi:acyl carrier protein